MSGGWDGQLLIERISPPALEHFDPITSFGIAV
jgi:hypothetical protein